MSEATVRAALVNFLTTPPIPGLGVVFQAMPFYAPGSAQDPLSGGTPGARAAAYVDFGVGTEERVTLPAQYGSKAVQHAVTIGVLYSYLRSTNTGTETPDAWASPLDALVEAIKDRIRSDNTLGDPAVIFQAGEGPLNTTPTGHAFDLRTRWSEPKLNGQYVTCWVAVDLDVIEIIEG